MPRPSPLLASLLAFGLATASGLAAPAEWNQLKPGMTFADAAKLLGQPLIRTNGRGFEVWIYDGKGEAVFAGGPLKEWTVAKPTSESLARPVERDVLIKPLPRWRLPRSTQQPAPPVEFFREISSTRFRYL